MKASDTLAYVESCFHGQPASCSFNCPVDLDLRSFLEKVSAGKWTAAYRALRNAVVFPEIVSTLCNASCKGACQRLDIGDDPINIVLLEQAVVKYAKKKTPEKYVIPPKEQSIAIVGAGVSGLACALDLAQKKYTVTIFDKADRWGGALREHERFETFSEDITLQLSAVSIETKFNHEVKSLEELAAFDGVYIASGQGGESFGLIESYDKLEYTTAKDNVFLGGGLTSADEVMPIVNAIAMGTGAAKRIAAFLQTGRVDSALPEKSLCSKHVDHTGEISIPMVIPTLPDGYTEDEAKDEASRCFFCDCTACFTSCEMLASFRKKPRKIATEVYTDTQVSSTFSTRTLTRQTFSCNMCSYCKSVCPEGINMKDLFYLSRRDRKKTGATPQGFFDYWMREMEFNNEKATFYGAANENTCEYVFYPGCQLGSYNPQHVIKTYDILSKNLNCGIYVGCCGAPAMWAGDDEKLQSSIYQISQTAKEMGDPTFILACSTCALIFDEHLPQVKHISLYKILSEMTQMPDCSEADTVSVFDPCSAREDTQVMESVRKLLGRSNIKSEELPEKNRCCGYGGLVRGGNPKMYETMVQHRTNLSDNPYITYCANCTAVFKETGKKATHILDIVLANDTVSKVPKISERRLNSLNVKEQILTTLDKQVPKMEQKPWEDIVLIINEEIAEEIDKKLISSDDMKQGIYKAETTGEKLYDEAEGLYTACNVCDVLTFWIVYKPLGENSFEVHSAYYHRMRFKSEGQNV